MVERYVAFFRTLVPFESQREFIVNNPYQRGAIYAASMHRAPHVLLALAPFVTASVFEEATVAARNIIYKQKNVLVDYCNSVFGEYPGYFVDAFLPDYAGEIIGRFQSIEAGECYVAFEAFVYFTIRKKLFALIKLGAIIDIRSPGVQFDYNLPEDATWMGISQLALRDLVASNFDASVDFFKKRVFEIDFSRDQCSSIITRPLAIDRYGYMFKFGTEDYDGSIYREYVEYCKQARSFFLSQ